MKSRPCKYCGKDPKMTFHPTLYFGGCWHIACVNEACDKKPSTWFYYDSKDAIAEWNELMMGAEVDDA